MYEFGRDTASERSYPVISLTLATGSLVDRSRGFAALAGAT